METIQKKGVGVYWTHDFEHAEAYCGEYNKEFILCAYVNVNYINWENTIEKSLYVLANEREIEVHEGADLELVSIYLKDYHNKYDIKTEYDKLTKLFGDRFTKSNNINDYLINKRKNMSTINFNPPIQVKA